MKIPYRKIRKELMKTEIKLTEVEEMIEIKVREINELKHPIIAWWGMVL